MSATYKAGRLTRPLGALELEAMRAPSRIYGRSWRVALGSAWERHSYMGVADKHVQMLAVILSIQRRGRRRRVIRPTTFVCWRRLARRLRRGLRRSSTLRPTGYWLSPE
jgi:hypothetical protein